MRASQSNSTPVKSINAFRLHHILDFSINQLKLIKNEPSTFTYQNILTDRILYQMHVYYHDKNIENILKI